MNKEEREERWKQGKTIGSTSGRNDGRREKGWEKVKRKGKKGEGRKKRRMEGREQKKKGKHPRLPCHLQVTWWKSVVMTALNGLGCTGP